MSHIQHIQHAASNSSNWGRWAAVRYIAKRTGYNHSTSLRVLTVALVCVAAESLAFGESFN